jgi:regulator of sigma E protease
MDLIIFLTVLSILIVVHEFGHFIVAKRCGVRVERFSLGFGPKLLSRTHDGTEFTLCLIPLGGFVKMAGDERANCKGGREEFFSHPVGHRALIVIMGPVVNYVLAYLCLVLVFLMGNPVLSNKVGEVMKDYPAAVAGLLAQDVVVRIEGQAIEQWEDLQKQVSESKGATLSVEVLRQGLPLTLTITPRNDVLKNIFGQEEVVRVIGVRPAEEMVTVQYGPLVSLGKAAEKLWEITEMTYKALYRMLTLQMNPKEAMTGPIGIFFIIQKAAEMGFTYLVYITGIISASLAIFNLLPLPVLDGGHLLFLVIEKVRGRGLSPKADDLLSRVGLGLILTLALFVFYSDFERFGWIKKIHGFIRSLTG